MILQDKNTILFLELVKSGLWEKAVLLAPYGAVDFASIMQIAREQTVIGLVAAGIENIADIKTKKKDVVSFIGYTIETEQKNLKMNSFIALLSEQLNSRGIVFTLVKGQGVALCYERPLWRSCGDIDLLLDDVNYQKAKVFLSDHADRIHEENLFDKHYSVDIEGWVVELHGSLRSLLTKRADRQIDLVQVETFKYEQFRTWNNNGTIVSLPKVDNEVFFIFTHILKHFFHYGIGLRQICDWCRLLWVYRDSIDLDLLKRRLCASGLMSEWKAFGTLAVVFLGMPEAAMPFYSPSNKSRRKARRILSFILKVGNHGQKRDKSYYKKYSLLISKLISFWRHVGDSALHFIIFPADTVCIFGRLVIEGINSLRKDLRQV